MNLQAARGVFSALATAAGAVIAAGGLTHASPDRVKEWAAVIGVNPAALVFGALLWVAMWAAHRQNVAAIRENAREVRALTHAILRIYGAPPPQGVNGKENT